MAILNFPANPQTDDQYTGDNGTTYTYDGVKWVGRAAGGAAGTNSLQNGSFTVQVDVDGDLVLPVGSIVKDAEGNPIGGGAGDRLTVGQTEVVLNIDGSLTFTNQIVNGRAYSAEALVFAKSNTQKAIATQSGIADRNTVERLVIAGGDSYQDTNTNEWFGEGGDIYIWPGRGANGGDIKLDAGESYGLNGNEGGWIKMRGGDSSTGNGGYLELTAGSASTANTYGGDITITSGSGPTSGRVTISTNNNNNWNFREDGRLQLPNGYALVGATNTDVQAGSAPTVVYTSLDGEIGGIKATIKVYAQSAWINGDFMDEDIQMCEMLISTKRRFVDNGGTWIKTAVASVYGVTHTTDAPLATFTVNYVEDYVSEPGATPRDVVQILAEPTAAVTGTYMWVMVTATELTND